MINTNFGYVALMGEPNVGKSTLLNRLVGTKLAIVTHKAQTTRTNLIGIQNREGTQIAFVDTPGIFNPKTKLDQAMVKSAWGSIKYADIISLMVQPKSGKLEENEGIIKRLKQLEKDRAKIILIVNKIDLVNPSELLKLVEALSNRMNFAKVFLISAKKGDGIEDLIEWYSDNLPKGPWLFPPDQISSQPVQSLACDITREKLLLRLHQEIPYNLSVETDQWKEMKNNEVRIDQNIVVARDGHKAMVIGASGSCIKQVGIDSRKDISKLLGQKVHLFLRVTVRKKWMDDEKRLREMGLGQP